jgi:hypothetical protein
MYKCKECSKEFDKLDSLRIHSMKLHQKSSKELYSDLFLNGEIPKCQCGCNTPTKFISLQKGYDKWIRGHISRVKNNWGHNQKAIDASADTRRKQYQSGERQVWNVGLTKETDDRVEQYGKLVSNSIRMNINEMERRSNWLSEARLSGKIPTKWGIESANWKGGATSINNLVRANKRLYNEWIFPILKNQNFECQTCHSTKELQVHHDVETMSEIIQKFVSKDKEYTFDDKRKIMNMIIDYHIVNNVSGKVLCKECHSTLHPSYNL